ncbi:LysR family transcriptional regulator [Pseudoduganella sp. DS3]|uniref:LysR family transcriptional regulator n=1 Tax=Pseudoduganella guangdongensis TaxID=2692179 RepID=A0A6N9HR86_9BURK|nr:LysR family transcriptional regulator [Pseudoduganella guangdongensis]MYN05345.1 LysR family transcriptional regulator [Pseudoduganella guangdongensis]
MRDPGLPTLDQLRVFIAVIDHGGFAHAARALHRTQSVISYTIANLEEQLNIALLDRSTRKPSLTEAGKALLADARAVASKVDSMRSRARALGQGLEAELSIVVDVMFPTCLLVRTLEQFQREFPTVALRLHTEALGAVAQMVADRRCQLGVAGMAANVPANIERHAAGFVKMMPVCSPLHALAQEAAPIPTAVLREHLQLVVTDRSPLTEGRDFGVTGLRDWRLGDLGSKHALLVGGLGWGNMPEHTIRRDMAEGRLLRLRTQEGHELEYPLFVIHRGDDELGPAGKWLRQQFIQLDHTLPHDAF